MKLICPSCGATHSAEAWINDAEAREAIVAVAGLPRDVARQALGYVALFRPATRALSWRRVRRLLEELGGLVAAAEVQWNVKPPRPNRPEAWARAMERICVHPPKHLPLESHNYLRTIAYQIADEMDAEKERYREAEVTKKRQEEVPAAQIQENRQRLRGLIEEIG